MSNERFDKLIKTNLESLRPAYSPRAWDRFQKRLPATGFWAGVASYGGWLLSGLMLTGWLTTLYTLRTNQQTMAQLAEKLSAPAQLNGRVAEDFPQQLVPNNRIDTVYVVKQTVVEHRHLYESAVLPVPKTGQRSGSDAGLPENRLANRSEGAKKAAPAPVTPADSVNRLITTATATIPTDLATAETTPGQPAVDQADVLNQKQAAKPVAASATAALSQPAQQSRPRFRLSSLQPRVGIETMASPNGVGVGPVLELFPTENLGLSLGLQASQYRLENHHELRDFNSATGREFIDQYRAYLPAQYDQIRDISVRTSLISLPLMLRYYVPIRRNWAVLVQTGTNLDVSSYQQVGYESLLRGTDQRHLFEIDSEPRFFHDFVFGAGVQYRRSRISAQLSPYYRYDFGQTPNMPGGSNVGVRASVWLNLFK
jgi:hypothetical protein